MDVSLARMAIFVALAIAAAPRTARADEALRMTWTAPAGCPSAEAVREAALRGTSREGERSVFRARHGEGAPLEVDAVVERGERWRVTLRSRRDGVAGERRIEASSCAAIADATAVVVALALVSPGSAPDGAPAPAPAQPRPTAATEAAQAAPAEGARKNDESPPAAATPRDPRGGEAAAAPTTRPAEGRAAGPSRDGHALAIGAAFATDASTMPAPAAGAGLSIAWTPGRARVELGAARYVGQSRTAPSGAAGAELMLTAVGARGCFSLLRAPIEIAPCAGADLQVVSASGFGAQNNYDADARWIAAAGGLLVRAPIASWLAIRLEGGASVLLSRARFVVDGDGPVHGPPALGARGSLGAELLFL